MADLDDDQTIDNEEELDTSSDADNENLDDEELDGEEGDQTTGSDDDTDTGTSDAEDADSGDATDDDEEDEVDPVGLAIMRSVASGAPQAETFDIRNLPRDENGMIDPDAANKAVQDWHDKQAAALNKEGTELNQVRSQLSGQWQTGAGKFPHIWKNPDLRDMALQFHLGSFEKARTGTGQYISPTAALKKVDKMYKRGFRQGATSQKIRKRVVSTAGSTRSSGAGASNQTDSEYVNLKKMAASKDPSKARVGRQKLLIYRRNARRANGPV